MTPRRNLEQELAAMGIEDDDGGYRELEARDARHQEEQCERQAHEEALSFIRWRRENAPIRTKMGGVQFDLKRKPF